MAIGDKAGDLLTSAKRRVGIENPSAAEEEGNVGVVRGALRAFGEGETDGFLEALAEDVTWEAPGGNFPGGGDLSGRDEVRDKYIDHAGRTFTEFGFVPESFVNAEAENAVIVFGRFTGEGAEGASVDVPGVQVWIMKGSEADLVRIYTDSAPFPEVVTEEKEREWEEEEKRKREEQEKEEQEAEGKGDGESSEEEDDEGDEDSSGAEAKSSDESSSESRSDDDSDSDSGESGDSGDSGDSGEDSEKSS